MTITMKREAIFDWDKELSWSFYTETGMKISRSFTPQTTEGEVNRFLSLLNKHEREVVLSECDCQGARMDNEELVRQGKPGKNWPAFTNHQRLLNRLQREAGIVDS